jgi:transcription elongation factor S-II
MASITIRTVNELKDSLSKELNRDDTERCTDIIDQLDAVQDMSLKVLSETLVGTVVSKFKAHNDTSVAAKAKALVKRWKQLAKQGGVGKSPSAGSSLKTKAKPVATKKPTTAPVVAASSSSSTSGTDWDHLPPLRKSTANKLHQIFNLSTASLTKSDIHIEAIKSLTISRATEVEIACHEYSKGIKQSYLDKIRSLIFNLKKNSDLRENVILGSTQPETLVTLAPEQLATAEKSEERNKAEAKLKDSRRLDWEQANEGKINEMCGIKGDLLLASLFTCGRCKSIKTTSTQKQTRSADEPMTVFVFCLNCGNRWRC